VITRPSFVSEQEYVALRGEAAFWRPYVIEILKRHELDISGQRLKAGTGPTYPTFLYGDVVVKLFGYRRWWREGYEAERAAHALLATAPQIAAPRLLAEGRLFDDQSAPWPYLITGRMPGTAWHKAGLMAVQRLAVAEELGRQIKLVQPCARLASPGTRPGRIWTSRPLPDGVPCRRAWSPRSTITWPASVPSTWFLSMAT